MSAVEEELGGGEKWYFFLKSPLGKMQWLFDVKICIVEIHTSVIILWFFYLYFMKGTKLHWNICCYKRENVDVIWIRLDTTMQCRGINRKDCSQVTDFGNFGFQSLLRRLGVLEKKLKVGSAAPRRLSIFFPKPPTSGAGFETKISKVRHLRAVFTVNTPTLHSRVQSYSDKIRFFPSSPFSRYNTTYEGNWQCTVIFW